MFKKLLVMTTIVLITVSQSQLLSTIAKAVSATPIETDDLRVYYLDQDKEKTTKDKQMAVGDELTLFVDSAKASDQTLEIPLGDDIQYDDKATAKLNETNKDVTIAYNQKSNSVYVDWTDQAKERAVQLRVKAIGEKESEIYAQTKRDTQVYQSKKVNIQPVSKEKATAANASSSESTDSKTKEATSEDDKADPDQSKKATVAAPKGRALKARVSNKVPVGTGILPDYEKTIVVDQGAPGVKIDGEYAFQPHYTKKR